MSSQCSRRSQRTRSDYARPRSALSSSIDGELIHLAALRNMTQEGAAAIRDVYPMPPGRGGAAARSILSRSVTHIADVLQDAEYAHRGVAAAAEFRSTLSVPMLRDGQPIGAISVAGPAPTPFPDK